MRGMRTLGAVLLVAVAGCNPVRNSPGYVPSSGTLAIDPAAGRVYVADRDHRAVFALDAKSGAQLGRIDLGAEPGELAVGPDRNVYVSLRSARAIARIDSNLSVQRADVGGEPVGLAFSTDGEKLYVANMTSQSVSVLDVGTLQPVQGDIPVGVAPRTLRAHPDGRLYVGDYLTGSVHVLSAQGQPAGRVDLVLPATTECGGGDERSPSQVAALTLSPDGERVYAVHVQSRLDIVPRGMQRPAMGGGPLAQAVAPAVGTIATRTDALQLDPTDAVTPACMGDDCAGTPDFPPALLVTACGPPPGMDAPSAMVVDKRGDWLFIADHNSDAVAVLSAHRRSDWSFRFPERGLAAVVRVGARPSGLALSDDERTLYVHSSLDYTVSVVRARNDSPSSIEVVDQFKYAASPLPPAADRGRRLFYSAVDPRMTQPELGGVSCSSCHPEGRLDGLTWRFSTLDESNPWASQATVKARNTPGLFGARDTGPYHWEGLVESLPAFSNRMVTTMGGQGMSTADADDLSAYMDTLTMPDIPARAAELSTGRTLFEGVAGCAGCHPSPLLTDRKRHDVTGLAATSIDTPSLRGVRMSPPYLHDGSAATLRDVLSPYATLAQHRVADKLSPDEVAALLKYVDSL